MIVRSSPDRVAPCLAIAALALELAEIALAGDPAHTDGEIQALTDAARAVATAAQVHARAREFKAGDPVLSPMLWEQWDDLRDYMVAAQVHAHIHEHGS